MRAAVANGAGLAVVCSIMPLLAAGCVGLSGPGHPPAGYPVGCVRALLAPDRAHRYAELAQRQWLREISRRGRLGRARRHPFRFASPRSNAFRDQLGSLSSRYGFTIQRVRFYRPLQLAPFVVVATRHPKRLGRRMFEIQNRLDPGRPGAYEGFYFEVRDRHGVPAFAVFDFERGKWPGGGQWARGEALYPYLHTEPAVPSVVPWTALRLGNPALLPRLTCS